MRVIWQLNETATCQISWGSDSTCSLGNAITEEYGDDHQHSYTITGLTPGTKYHYKVVYDDDIIQASFFTAPPEDAENIKFFVYGDTRSDIVNHDLNSQSMIADYQLDPALQSLTLFTGDHVDYGAEESSWQNTFFTSGAPNIRKRMAEVPFVPCLGNHEMYKTGFTIDYSTSVYGKYFPFPFVKRRYWSFDYGPMHVAVLDHYPDYYQLLPLEGRLDTTQILWLEEDLANTDKSWKVIIIHEPGWSCEGSSSGYQHPNNPDVQNLLQPILEEHGVQIVFTAHNHYYARACKNGIYHITTAGGGAPLYEVEEAFPNVSNTLKVHHYCKVAIEGETMMVTAVKPDGEVIDEFHIDQNNKPEHLLGFLDKEEGPGDISDVNITASGQSTNPDVVGYYGLELAPGYHQASFLLADYAPVNETIEVFEGTETQLDTTLMLSESCLPEGIAFSTQEEIDNFQVNYPGCTEIEGDVQIHGEDITNLEGLSIVTSIGGDLTVGDNSIYAYPANNALESLIGLEGLTSVGGNLVIAKNASLLNLTGITNLAFVVGDLIIFCNDTLNSLNGLGNLSSIEGDLKIGLWDECGFGDYCVYGNESLLNIEDLENLNFIGDNVWFLGNTSLQNLTGMENITNIGGDLWILENDSLKTLSGLENLTAIGGGFSTGYSSIYSTYGNISLNSLTGLDSLTNLNGGLSLINNYVLTDLNALSNLISLGGDLNIYNNDLLENLSGLENINPGIIQKVEIEHNNSLAECHVQSICEYLTDTSAIIYIWNNAPGCNSPEEVIELCLVSVDEKNGISDFNIYPSPVGDFATLSFKGEGQGTTKVMLYNSTGVMVKTWKLNITVKSQSNLVMDFSALPAGMYCCQVQVGDKVMMRKLIKQ